MGWLYLIEILHQTTTRVTINTFFSSCILSKFYIKPQPTARPRSTPRSCILSKFYIKPQLFPQYMSRDRCCILSKFYIKPQQSGSKSTSRSGCILSKFYIKPQPLRTLQRHDRVVSYRNSTSNHNRRPSRNVFALLYLIEILHQTTTSSLRKMRRLSLYLIEILHQTTTSRRFLFFCRRCILSKFYIKPQRRHYHP